MTPTTTFVIAISIIASCVAFYLYDEVKYLRRKVQAVNYENELLYSSIDQLTTNLASLTEIQTREMAAWKATQEQAIREDALARSRAVMRGQATEHLAPLLLTDFSFKDFRFVGNPIDYLVINSSSAIHDGTATEIEEIVLLDIKTGSSSLSRVQRQIRNAVIGGRVKFCVYNSDTQTLKTWTTKEELDDND